MSDNQVERTPNEKYLEVYIDVLKNTFNEQVHRNISQQANSRLLTDMLQELQKQNQFLAEQINKLNNDEVKKESDLLKQKENDIVSLRNQIAHIENVKNSEITSLRNQIQSGISSKNSEVENLKNQVDNLNREKAELNSVLNDLKNEYNGIKGQVDHIETFKNQIIQMQQTLSEKDSEIDGLNKKINNLKSPTKKKVKTTETISSLPIEDTVPVSTEEDTQVPDLVLVTEETRDGGSF
jgi:chromosome segregation ATPase